VALQRGALAGEEGQEKLKKYNEKKETKKAEVWRCRLTVSKPVLKAP